MPPEVRNSEYFIVLEDDVRFKFILDFDKLIQAAPKGFGALQLMMSHKIHIKQAFERYAASPAHDRELFSYRPRNSTIWSAQAILYRKEAVRGFIESAVTRDRHGKLGYRLLNSFDYPKFNTLHENEEGGRPEPLVATPVNPYRPVIPSECLFADMFLYSMAHPTFILNVPILNSALLGLNSSFHQVHVPYHVHGFLFIQTTQHQLGRSDGKYHLLLPRFATPFAFVNDGPTNVSSSSSSPSSSSPTSSSSSSSSSIVFSELETDWREVIRTDVELQLRHLPKRLKGLGNTDEFRNG